MAKKSYKLPMREPDSPDALRHYDRQSAQGLPDPRMVGTVMGGMGRMTPIAPVSGGLGAIQRPREYQPQPPMTPDGWRTDAIPYTPPPAPMQHGPSVGMDGAPMDPHAYMRMLQAQQMMERMRQQNSRGAWGDTMQMTPFSVFGGQ